jgi:hypothetical protein
MRNLVLLTFIAILGSAVVAQRPTFREQIAVAQADVTLSVFVDGPPVLVVDILKETDLVVRALIGQVEGHLSEDGREISTSYELLNPHVFFSATAATSSTPGETPPPLSLTVGGGAVRIDGFTATETYDNAPELSTGMEVIVLLHSHEGKYQIARGGIFGVRDSTIIPLVNMHGEQQKFSGMNADAFLAEVVTLRKQLQTTSPR